MTAKNQVRVRANDFADLTAIDRVLRQSDRSIAVYKQLEKRDQERLYFYLPYCPSIAEPTANDCIACHRAYPKIGPTGTAVKNEPPKISPFTHMEFKTDPAIVTFRSTQYELLGVDHLSMNELVKRTQGIYRDLWKKRLSEDLVEVLWRLDHQPGETVGLRLRSLENGEEITIENALMTKENRRILYRNNEHNQD